MAITGYNNFATASAPNDEQIQHALAQKHYAANMPSKEMSVQERLSQTLGSLSRALSILDSLENAPNQAESPHPELGLIQAALVCQQQAEDLVGRLSRLREGLGRL